MDMHRSWKLEALIIASAFTLATARAHAQSSDPVIPAAGPSTTSSADPPTPTPPATEATPEAAPITATTTPATDTHASSPRSVYDVRLSIDIPVILAGATAGLLRTYLANHIVQQRCPCSVDEINAFDRHVIGNHSDAAGLVSDITVGLALGIPPVLDLFIVGPNRVFAEDLIVATETVMVSTLFQQVANFGFQRPRPRTYVGDPSSITHNEGYLSFLAGHVATTTAVLAASSFTIRKRYGEHVWPWVVTGLVAASVGTERMLGGYHFPSDVALGGALGLGVGLAVPWLHARHPEVQLAIAPTSSGYELSLLGQF
jgi:membrane-associated phospholipid phosphatase